MNIKSENIWFAEPPEKFGELPKRMSVSILKEIESCPRKYALRRADYSQIWNGFGYPNKPSLKALEGIIVHRSIEHIIKALRKAGCPSISDELFVKTMRSLDGYSGVLEKQFEKISDELITNPRSNYKADKINQKLRDTFPTLREQLQTQASKLKFDNKAKATNFSGIDNTVRSLSNGIHAEVELNAPELEWYGKVDYLNLSPNECEIADFKTGERKSEHIFQIKIYNLLWNLDKIQNPNTVPVTKLNLLYNNEDIKVPPLTSSEVDDFIDEVKQRTNFAKSRILQPVPEAKPTIENCRYCSVRQLCSAYWTQNTQELLEKEKLFHQTLQKKNGIDIEIKLENSIAEHIWYARTLISGSITPQTQLLVRFAPTSLLQIPIKLKSGLQLRLLNVSLLEQNDEEGSSKSIVTNWVSEIFIANE